MPSLSKAGILASEVPAFAKYGRQLRDVSEILVVARPFFRKQSVERVVEIVAPLPVDAVAAALARQNHARIIQVAFRDQMSLSSKAA